MGDILSGLFGGGSGNLDVQTITPPTPEIPGLNNINQIGQNRAQATNPYTLSPWRAIDFLHNFQAPQNHVPQFQPQQHSVPPPQPGQQQTAGFLPGNNQLLTNDFQNPHSQLQEPQMNPLAMVIGQLFNDLGALYQNTQANSLPGRQEPTQGPSIENRQASQLPNQPPQGGQT